jgi:hypothetical protein
MDWFAKRLPSVRLIFTISLVLVASLSNNLAGAQQMCAELFAHGSPQVPLAEMTEAYERMLTDFVTPEQMTSDALRIKVGLLAKSIQDYLDTAGISYEVIPQPLPIQGLKDQPEFVLTYPMYALSGSQHGTRLARMMNGVRMTKAFQEKNLRIVLDPLYQQHFSSRAHFRQDLMVILIGPHEFSQEVSSISSALRHEIAHVFEQMKLVEGKNTLARIEMSSQMGTPDKVYSDNFRADEVETHLLDLRTISNLHTQKIRDGQILKDGGDPETVKQLKTFRNEIKFQTKDTILDFSNNLRSVIGEIEGHLEKPKPWATIQRNPETGDVFLMFFTSHHYGSVTLNLNGLVKPSEINDTVKMKQAVQQILAWSKIRLDGVEKEVIKFTTPKLNIP